MSVILKFLRPTLISLFAGWGGGSSGFRQAGFHEILAVDTDKHSRKSFALNFPKVPVVDLDLSIATGDEILEKAGIKAGELDVLVATPPCQGISRAGKFVPNHPLNQLTLRTIDFVEAIQPKVFVIENVSSINQGRMRPFSEKLMDRVLQLNSYNVEFRMLNAIHYNVPQRRERFIMIGVRKDLGVLPVFPEPSLQPIHVNEVLPNIKAFTYGYQSSPSFKTGDGLMSTITKTENVWAIEDGIRRALTTEEVLTLCGYPKDWKVTGSRNQIWQRAGNSLMPNMAEAIAKTILNEILTKTLLKEAA